jgi:hypothetical protein
MPYDPQLDQYYQLGAGYTSLPERDGTGYHPEYPSPVFFQSWFEMNADNISRNTHLHIVIVGKFYKTSDEIKGIPGTIDMASLQNISFILDPSVTEEQKAEKLMGLKDTPEKLVGLYFRVLD